MHADVVPGARFPDYELTDHTEHQQHHELVALYPRINVGYARLVTITTDTLLELNEFRIRPDWDLGRPGLKENWEGDKVRHWPYRRPA